MRNKASIFHIEAQITSDELLKAVRQLSVAELEGFLAQVIALQAQKKAASLPQREAELLLKINQGIPAEIRQRYGELKRKRRSETLTPREHRELLHLTAQVEKVQAQRIEYLAELASIRQTTLKTLMKDLGIQTPAYA